MDAGGIILIIIFVGCIIAGIARSLSKKTEQASVESVPSQPVSKPLSELTDIELMERLREAEADIEIQKIKYQSYLTNPYCWPVTRDLAKSNLDSAIERKLSIVSELDKRKLSSVVDVEIR